MKSKIILLGLTVALLATLGIAGTNGVGANDNTTFPPAIQALIDRFDLNEDEVSEVLEETRAQKHEEKRALMGEKLDGLVSEGKLTEEQKSKLLTKLDEMKANNEEWRNIDKEEVMEIMRQRKEEMKSWAKSEGINLEEIFLGEGFKEEFNRGKHY